MQTIKLDAQSRQGTGKGPNRSLRASGQIPAVLYGQEAETVNLAVNGHNFQNLVTKVADELVMFDLTVEKTDIRSQLMMIREIQRDPVTERLVHIDFIRVDLKKPIDVHVAVHGHGSPVGVREGGVLEQINRTVHLRCLPDLIPSEFDLDVEELAIGDAIHVSDLEVAEGIQILSPEDFVLFHVIIPRQVEEEEPEVEEGEELAEGEEKPEDAEGAEEGEKSEA